MIIIYNLEVEIMKMLVMIMGWWWWWWGWWTWGPMWNYWWSWWWWWYSYSWWLPADYIPVDMNTGHVNKMHELLTNRRGHIWWSYCIFLICFVHQTSTNTIIIIIALVIVIIFYPTTLDLQPLSTLAPSDLWQKTSPSLKRVKNNIFFNWDLVKQYSFLSLN